MNTHLGRILTETTNINFDYFRSKTPASHRGAKAFVIKMVYDKPLSCSQPNYSAAVQTRVHPIWAVWSTIRRSSVILGRMACITKDYPYGGVDGPRSRAKQCAPSRIKRKTWYPSASCSKYLDTWASQDKAPVVLRGSIHVMDHLVIRYSYKFFLSTGHLREIFHEKSHSSSHMAFGSGFLRVL